jgi:hypothetical protein
MLRCAAEHGTRSSRGAAPAKTGDNRLSKELLSHFHGDHFDQAAQRDQDRTLPIETLAEAARELQEPGFTQSRSLETWQSVDEDKGSVRLRSPRARDGTAPV